MPFVTSPTFGDPRLPVRFWAKVNEHGPVPAHRSDLGPCWEWTASRNNNGYGVFRWQGRLHCAHRIVYQVLVGLIPDGLESDHLCRNPPCVNPAHIEAVTHRVNSRRGNVGAVNGARQMAKTHCLHGHLYDEMNTYRTPDGRRNCRACRRTSSMESYYRVAGG